MQFRGVSSLRGEGTFRTISGHKGTRFLLPRHPPPVLGLGFVVDTEQIERQSSDVVSQGKGSFLKTIVASSDYLVRRGYLA